MLSHHGDGIIWTVPEVGDNHHWVENLALNLEIPTAYLTMEPQENISIVSIDNYQGGRIAKLHLMEQGYHHIAHISGPLDWWENRQRMAAWKDALREVGFEAGDEYCIQGNWFSTSSVQVFDKLLVQYQPWNQFSL